MMLPFPEGAGTLAQWVIALFSGATFAAVMKFVISWRGQTLDNDEKIRGHYSQEINRLQQRLNNIHSEFLEDIQKMEGHYRAMLNESDKRHEECQKDRDALRQEINGMHEEIAGLKAQIRRYSTDKLMILEKSGVDQEKAPEAIKSAHRLRDKRGEGDDL